MYGSADWMTVWAAKKLMSKRRRISSFEISSTAPVMPKPALFRTTSIWPNFSTVLSTAALIAASFVRSTSIGSNAGFSPPTASKREETERVVAATWNPSRRRAFTVQRPKPFEAPVTNQTWRVML